MNKIIGFEKIKEIFINLNKNNSIPTKLIFSGNEGIGKFLLAKDFANNIYCDQIKKTDSNLNPNILIIEKDKDKQSIEISKIREMIKYINHSSFNNDKRIVLIRDIETLNINSSNALLKSLEEGLILCAGFYKNGILLAPSCSNWISQEIKKHI